ncbi:MAG: aminoacyl-tRNA hydrolase [Bacteroidetes bacterium]|nr:aminoacyl-tRNA hydrolase [Bacteroidota bacterium]MCW5897504.1 aminoacyl-tRNA hydrolase [Bacteroidota bacterium]
MADESIIVVGLGNPGFEYEDTRHNVGFMVVEEVSVRLGSMWKPGKGEYLFTTAIVDGKQVVLVKPLTYMNNSGSAVVEVLERFPARIENVLVVVDDLALELGTIRIRAKGSDGGHNGLRSLIYYLNSNEFPRIRCGIQQKEKPPKRDVADFVLSPFESDRRDEVEMMIRNAADAVEEFFRSGIERTMNLYNTRSRDISE